MGRPGLKTHLKFRRLQHVLGSAPLARGILETIWDSCYECGDDYLGTATDIEQLVGWTGERGALTRALLDAGVPGAGFIEAIADVMDAEPHYRVHNLWRHAPHYVEQRKQREIARISRTGVSRTAPNGAVQQGSAPNGRTPSPSPSPSPSPTSTVVTNCGEALEQRSPLVDEETPTLVFPVVTQPKGKHAHKTTWPLMAAQLREWTEVYEALDVAGECRKALAWIKANPSRRKTYGGMPSFLNSWLARVVNRGSGGGTVITGSLKTAGNKAALERFLQRHTDALDE